MLLLTLSLLAFAQDVTLTGETWAALQPPEPPAPAPAPPRTPLRRRLLVRDPVDGRRTVDATWDLSGSPSWTALEIADQSVTIRDATLDGRPLAITTRDDGRVLAEVPPGAAGMLRVSGHVDGDAMWLLPAATGEAWYEGDQGLAIQAEGYERPTIAGHCVMGDADILLAPERVSTTETSALLQARIATGITVGDADVRYQARVHVDVRRGTVNEVRLNASGVGADVSVRAPAGVRIDRRGDEIVASLPGPTRSSVELSLTWTSPLSAGDVQHIPAPRIAAIGALSTESVLQIARDAELEVVPEITGGRAISARSLPEWGRGLVDGTPVAAWTGATRGSLTSLRFTPATQPAMIVDVAEHDLAFSQEGRAVGHTRLTIRNERAASLRIALPANTRILALTVDGRVTAAAPHDGGWRTPIPRSLETAQGPLAFPVDIWWLTEGAPFTRRDDRAVPLPTVDAPVAAVRTQVHLPRHARPEAEQDRALVEVFREAEGIAYGFGDVDADQAEGLFRGAVDAYLKNDLAAATESLATLREMGASNVNIDRLSSNIASLTGGGDSVVDRRLRAQAQARSFEGEVAQAAALEAARDAERRGDVEAAASSYQSALSLGSQLAALEQKEEIEQEEVADEVAIKLEDLERRSSAKKQALAEPKPVDFQALTIPGALSVPEGRSFVAPEPIAEEDAEDEPDFAPPTAATYDVSGVIAGVGRGGPRATARAPATSAPAPPPNAAYNENTYEADELRVVQSATVSRAPARPAPRRAATPSRAAPAPPPPPPPVLDGFGESSDTPIVVATRPGVVIPDLGPILRFEHTLLAADAAPDIHIFTRTKTP